MTRERNRGEVHLGDLAAALATLPWQDQAQAGAIAACLGFGLRAPLQAAPHRVYDRGDTRTLAEGQHAPAPEPPVLLPPTPPRPVPLPAGTLPSRLTRLPNLAPPYVEPPDWLDAGANAFPPAPLPALARATLLPERTARHVISAALATRRPGWDIQLPRLVATLCRREPLRELPRRAERTLALGCQVLLDYSGRMVPFWEDLNALTVQVQEVVGTQATRVYSFDTRPTQARDWTPDGEPRHWEPDGRPVLAATDLGIQGRSGAAPSPDWHAFAGQCAKAGSPLVLLIPWPEERWPRTFPTNATLVQWGPRTSAGMVCRQSATLAARR